MKQTLFLFFILVLGAFGLALGTPVHATDIQNYVPLAPIDYTIPGGAEKNCEAKIAALNRIAAKEGAKSQNYLQKSAEYKSLCGTSLPQYLRGIYYGGVILAGFFAVFSIVRGGFTLLFTDSILGHSEAKGQILRAVGGLIVVYLSYALMNTINPALGTNLNLSLDFPRVTVDRGLLKTLLDTGAPGLGEDTAEALDRYGMQLDQILEKVDATQNEAKDLARKIWDLEGKLYEGDWSTPAEQEQLKKQIASLRAQEVLTRNYGQAVNKITQDRIRMNNCLNGQGDCARIIEGTTPFSYTVERVRGALFGRSAAQIAADNTVADQYVTTERAYVTEQAGKLEAAATEATAAGLATEAATLKSKADDLRAQLATTEKMNTFWKACPNAGVYLRTWQAGQPCPPRR